MNEPDAPIDGDAMTDQDFTLAPPTPVPPSRPWRRIGMILLIPAAAVLALYAALPAPPVPGMGMEWILPRGWTAEKNEGGMRYATLKPAGPGKVDVSVIALPAPAGGELANVNRWRSQVDLPPIDEAAVDALGIRVKARVGQVSVFDLDNAKEPQGRVVVGMLRSGSEIWFVKMAGDRASIAKVRPAFLKLLESFRPNGIPS